VSAAPGDTVTLPEEPDVYAPHRTTFPARLWAACQGRAAALGHASMAAYLVALMRADLRAGGVAVPVGPLRTRARRVRG
jgi:hypothetical protein